MIADVRFNDNLIEVYDENSTRISFREAGDRVLEVFTSSFFIVSHGVLIEVFDESCKRISFMSRDDKIVSSAVDNTFTVKHEHLIEIYDKNCKRLSYSWACLITQDGIFIKLWNCIKLIISLLRKFIVVSILKSKIMETADDYSERATDKLGKKNFKGAFKDYNKAIKFSSEPGFYYWNRGNAKNECKDYTGAIEDYTKAFELDCENAWLYLDTIAALKANTLQDYNGASAAYTKIIEDFPNFKSAYLNRGLCKLKLGQKESAFSDFNKAIELGTANKQAYVKEHEYLKKSLMEEIYKEFMAQL